MNNSDFRKLLETPRRGSATPRPGGQNSSKAPSSFKDGKSTKKPYKKPEAKVLTAEEEEASKYR